MRPALAIIIILSAFCPDGGTAGQAGNDAPVMTDSHFVTSGPALVTADSIGHPDRAAMLGRDFSGAIITERAPEGANGLEKASFAVRRQLTGKDVYCPPNYMFFRAAVRELGLIPAVFATLDRITRDNRLGAAHLRIDEDRHCYPEGPEVYRHARPDRASGGLPVKPAMTEETAAKEAAE